MEGGLNRDLKQHIKAQSLEEIIGSAAAASFIAVCITGVPAREPI
jgi:hypothetical protein